MITGKNVSVGTILYKVLRNPIATDLSYEQAAEFTLEFIRLLGAPLAFEDKVTNPPLKISDHKALLPKNSLDIRGVKYSSSEKGDGIAMRYASDVYHGTEDHCNTEYTYTLQNCMITTSQKDGYIHVSYKAIATDEFGYPLVPDNESFKLGLEYYILHRYLEPLWMMGKITDKSFEYIQQKRYFYTGQADSSMKLANIDHLETMMNSINRLIVDVNPQSSFYKNFGEKQIIRQHR